jgi:hypothetical protein
MALRVEGGFAVGPDLPNVVVKNHLLTPAEAEIRLTFSFERKMPNVEVRGRLVGPRCPYASTVEVAYPMQTLPRQQKDGVVGTFIIPEPSLWEPTCPFLYQGPIELLANGEVQYRWLMSHGLRRLQLGRRGLLWNGQPFWLRGLERPDVGEAEALALREAGYNCLMVREGFPCDAADRLGFLVLCRLPEKLNALTPAEGFRGHPSFLASVVSQELLEWTHQDDALSNLVGDPEHLLGVELTRPPSDDLPDVIAFVCCSEDVLPRLGKIRQPRIVLADREPPIAPTAGEAAILGWIRV